jgi:hypothetical protein
MKKLNHDWIDKFFAERRRVNGHATEGETNKAKAKILGILEYKRTLVNYLENNKNIIANHINGTVRSARIEMIDKVLDLLHDISPEQEAVVLNGFSVEQNRQLIAYTQGNRDLILYQNFEYQDSPPHGWYDKFGAFKFESIHKADYHLNMDSLRPILQLIKADIIINHLEDVFDNNYVMATHYTYLNVVDVWNDAVNAVKKLTLFKHNKKSAEKSAVKLYVPYEQVVGKAKIMEMQNNMG